MDISFRFIGWCKEVDKATGADHDKVWTAFEVEGVYYAGWGRRGKSLSFKKYGKGWSGENEQNTVMRKKKAKYNEVDAFQLFAVFPFFQDDVEKYLTFGILANKIK